jgi:hypothetical protein
MGQNGSMKLSKLGEDVTETRPDRCWDRALSQPFSGLSEHRKPPL